MSQQHQILVGDCIEMMRTLPEAATQFVGAVLDILDCRP